MRCDAPDAESESEGGTGVFSLWRWKEKINKIIRGRETFEWLVAPSQVKKRDATAPEKRRSVLTVERHGTLQLPDYVCGGRSLHGYQERYFREGWRVCEGKRVHVSRESPVGGAKVFMREKGKVLTCSLSGRPEKRLGPGGKNLHGRGGGAAPAGVPL